MGELMMAFTKKLAVTALLITAFSFQANADMVTQDYQSTGDGLITLDTASQLEWLDVSIFAGMNLSMLQGANQWTADGFQLATGQEIFDLFRNAGITYIYDEAGPLDFGESHTLESIGAVADLYAKLGGGTANFGGNDWIHGIYADDNNNGTSYLARLHLSSAQPAAIGTNGDNWGGTAQQSNAVVGAFFVRSAQVADVSVASPVLLSLMGLGLMGLSRRRR